MSNERREILTTLDEATERLIARNLDGEASPEERARLAGLLLRDPEARAMFEAYEQIDRLAAEALRQELTTAPLPGRVFRRRDWFMTAGAAVLTAAAVVALSFAPHWWTSGSSGPSLSDSSAAPSVALPSGGGVTADPRMISSPANGPWNYQEIDHQPVRRLQDIRQDFIGIPGQDKNQIFIFERNTHTTRLVPVSGDI